MAMLRRRTNGLVYGGATEQTIDLKRTSGNRRVKRVGLVTL